MKIAPILLISALFFSLNSIASGNVWMTSDKSILAVDKQEGTNKATVVIKIPKLTLEQYNKVVNEFGKDIDINIEYSCVEAGIIIVRIVKSQFKEKADFHTLVTNKINKVKGIKEHSILDISVEVGSGEDKC